jgi:hypothetical protein
MKQKDQKDQKDDLSRRRLDVRKERRRKDRKEV